MKQCHRWNGRHLPSGLFKPPPGDPPVGQYELGDLVIMTSTAWDGSSPSRLLGRRRLRCEEGLRDGAGRADDQAPTGSARLIVGGNGGRP